MEIYGERETVRIRCIESWYYLHGRGKRRINDFFLGMINRALNFVVVERKFAWKGTIQSCLAERGPYLSHHYLSTPIVLAHSCYPRIDFLKRDDSFNIKRTQHTWENIVVELARSPCRNLYTRRPIRETENTRGPRFRNCRRTEDRSAIWNQYRSR